MSGQRHAAWADAALLIVGDLGNGWFVDSAEDVVGFARDGVRPTEVVGALQSGIVVFGTDGGGALLAVSNVDGRVYRLREGAFTGSTYDVDPTGVEVLAADSRVSCGSCWTKCTLHGHRIKAGMWARDLTLDVQDREV